jgi:hypothetical protein
MHQSQGAAPLHGHDTTRGTQTDCLSLAGLVGKSLKGPLPGFLSVHKVWMADPHVGVTKRDSWQLKGLLSVDYFTVQNASHACICLILSFYREGAFHSVIRA